MNRSINIITFLALAASIVVMAGCGPKQRAAEGLLDTPESHYNQGLRKFNIGDLNAAQDRFEDGLFLDKDYAPAHAGLALVYASQGAKITDPKSTDRKELFKDAENHLDKAKGLDDEDVRIWIAYIRCHAIMKRDDDWIKDCEKGLEKALKIDARSDEAYYYMGLAYKQGFAFRNSEDMLRSAIEIDGTWSEKAGEAMQSVHKIVQAQPGTKYGKLIALHDKISRSDMAVLFIEELNVVERIERREATSTSPDLAFQAEDPLEFPAPESGYDRMDILDIEGHWAESMIHDFIGTGIFEIGQDHKFYPDEPVTKIEFAGAVQRLIYMVTQDESIFSKYIGESESHIRDMRTDHPFYGAAMLAVERNIMDLDKITGNFRPNEGVSGPDALLFIRDIQNALKW
jgi:tetratricopeptide (TPR) repeat protein